MSLTGSDKLALRRAQAGIDLTDTIVLLNQVLGIDDC